MGIIGLLRTCVTHRSLQKLAGGVLVTDETAVAGGDTAINDLGATAS